MKKKQTRELFFIAVVPEGPLFTLLTDEKKKFSDEFKTVAALRSPPHITLHMPFQMQNEEAGLLKSKLRNLVSGLSGFEIELSDYGSFPPRVIFVNVIENDHLSQLHQKIKRVMRGEFNFINQDYKDQGFHPHITVAFRDLRKAAFNKAWEKYKEISFKGEFFCTSIWVLKHNRNRWEMETEIPFTGTK